MENLCNQMNGLKVDKKMETQAQNRMQTMLKDMQRYYVNDLTRLDEKDIFTIQSQSTPSKSQYKVSFIKTNQQLDHACSCKDFIFGCKKGEIFCKHILFILHKVIKYPFEKVEKNENQRIQIKDYQLYMDLMSVLPINRFILLQQQGIVLENEKEEIKISNDDEDWNIREKEDNNDCAICCEKNEKDISQKCKTCRNFFHNLCIKQWISQPISKKRCIYCRSSLV